MKVTAYCTARSEGYTYSFTPNSIGDVNLFSIILDKKKEKDAKDGKDRPLLVTLELPSETKTFKQLGAVFKLISCIFWSQNGRNPTEDEKRDLYLDLLEEYGDRVPSGIDPAKTRPIHLSESDTVAAAHFIEALMGHLASECGLPLDVQSDVRDILFKWEASRGSWERDPLDECKSLSDWRSRHNYSQASGLAGGIELAHIVSRGASEADKFEPWNLLALRRDEHAELHQKGWVLFLQKYPHLTGRVERAFKLAGKKPVNIRSQNEAVT